MLLDNENFIEMKSKKRLDCDFKIGKNGIATVAKKTAIPLRLQEYQTLSLFIDKTNNTVVGVRFYKGLKGDFKVFKHRSAQFSCRSLLSKYPHSYLGEYRLEKYQEEEGFLDCLFTKEAQNGDN